MAFVHAFARRLSRRVYVPLLVLVLAGVALRALTIGVYSTVVTDYFTGDAGRYLRVGFDGVFSDPWQPAGYPLFLDAIRAITDVLAVTITVQHLLGVVTALTLYATVRRAGGSRPVALVPAAVALLSGDQLFIEHAFLTEALWMPLLAGGLYAAVRGGAGGDLRWLAAAGALFGLSIIVRNVSLVLPFLLAAWLLWVTGGSARRRVTAAASALLPALAVVALYAIVASASGPYTGLGQMSGWSLYGRVGQFADCRQFTPPKGSESLCETRPTGERAGAFFYLWSTESPAKKEFAAMSPEDDDTVGSFARAAVLGQPLDYARTVAKDVVRYFDPEFGFDRELSGTSLEAMGFRSSADEPVAFAATVRAKYSHLQATPGPGSGLLESWQNVFRTTGLILLISLALTAIGIVRGAAYVRAVCVLCGAFAVVLLVLPPAVSSYEGRYALPAFMILTVSAALGVTALARRGRPDAPTEEAAAPGASRPPARREPTPA